ncbi:hypothetical protein BV898_00566 [Hypsibius exemplaris]|uniref:Uncharacterized protein n=1 Tax=Hypsibius exemplaris TaxID=2072580 RepID=A0A1W0XE44_HYPEX|nr:hypothetical protein BV898_00566 [Hypsibius exemplaris]
MISHSSSPQPALSSITCKLSLLATYVTPPRSFFLLAAPADPPPLPLRRGPVSRRVGLLRCIAYACST